jgi:hypothetical protein
MRMTVLSLMRWAIRRESFEQASSADAADVTTSRIAG